MSEPSADMEALAWREALAPLTAAEPSIVRRIVVLDETTSTQDACRRLAEGRPGLLVTTRRQTAGRGRLGRHWADERGEGVALTISVPAQPPERLSIASAIAVAQAAEYFAGRRLGIRWPNDIMAEGRKLAGILIDQQADIALIGIGVNVNQAQWPADLAPVAVSLRQLTHDTISRPSVVAQAVASLTAALAQSEEQLAAAFTSRDVLVGTTQTFTLGHELLTGIVERIDPLQGLLIRTPAGERALPAAQTSLMHS